MTSTFHLQRPDMSCQEATMWPPPRYAYDRRNKTLGIVGYGDIGRSTAGIDMHRVAGTRPWELWAMETLAEQQQGLAVHSE